MQPRALNTMNCIVKATAQLLVENSGDTTTNHIAERSGYSVGTVYQRFANKEEIYSLVMDGVLEPPVQAIEDFTPTDNLKLTLHSLIAVAAASLDGQDPALWRVLETLPSGEFARKRQAAEARAIKYLEAILVAHRNEIAPTDLGLTARMLIAAIEGIALATDRELFHSPKFFEECLNLFYAYLKYREPPEDLA